MANRAPERKTLLLLPSPSDDIADYFSNDAVWILYILLQYIALSGLNGVDFVSITC